MTNIAFNRSLRAAMLLLLCAFFTGCIRSPYYQDAVSVPPSGWSQTFKPTFVVDVQDTNIHYNVSFIVRHTNNYPYANIWVKVLLKAPGDTSFRSTRVEIPLADQQGNWLGRGMGELYEQRRMIVLDHQAIPVTDELTAMSETGFDNLFTKPGRYEFAIAHDMRDLNLPEIIQVGMRVEKSSARQTPKPAPKAAITPNQS